VLVFQLFPSPTTGAFPSEPFNWMGTPENLPERSVKDEQQQCFDFTFHTAVSSVPATMAGTTQTESYLQSSMTMAPLVSHEHELIQCTVNGLHK
jgi:WRKY transcription factor 33